MTSVRISSSRRLDEWKLKFGAEVRDARRVSLASLRPWSLLRLFSTYLEVPAPCSSALGTILARRRKESQPNEQSAPSKHRARVAPG